MDERLSDLKKIALLEIELLTQDQIEKIKSSSKKDLKLLARTSYGRHLISEYFSNKDYICVNKTDTSDPYYPKTLVKDLVFVIWEELNIPIKT